MFIKKIFFLGRLYTMYIQYYLHEAIGRADRGRSQMTSSKNRQLLPLPLCHGPSSQLRPPPPLNINDVTLTWPPSLVQIFNNLWLILFQQGVGNLSFLRRYIDINFVN